MIRFNKSNTCTHCCIHSNEYIYSIIFSKFIDKFFALSSITSCNNYTVQSIIITHLFKSVNYFKARSKKTNFVFISFNFLNDFILVLVNNLAEHLSYSWRINFSNSFTHSTIMNTNVSCLTHLEIFKFFLISNVWNNIFLAKCFKLLGC